MPLAYSTTAVLALALASSAAGCFSTSIAQAPRTVPAGELQVGLGGGIVAWTEHESAQLVPECALRYGLADGLELGAKTTLASLEAQAKVQLARGDFDLSTAVSGAASKDPDTDGYYDEYPDEYDGIVSGRAMLLVGQRMGRRLSLVLMGDALVGRRGGVESDTEQAWKETFVGVGGGLGMLFHGSIDLLPEIVVTHFVEGDAPDFVESFHAGDTSIQLTVTAMFGGTGRDERAPRNRAFR